MDDLAVHRLGGSPSAVWAKPWSDEMLYVFTDRKQERLRLEVVTDGSRVVSVTRKTYPVWTTSAVFDAYYTPDAFREKFGSPTREEAGQHQGQPARVWIYEDPAVSRALLQVYFTEQGALISAHLGRMPEPGAPR